MATRKKATPKKVTANKAIPKKAAPKKRLTVTRRGSARTSNPPKAAAPRKPAPAPAAPRAAGERWFWLLKTEPEVFSMEALLKAPNATTHWDGVRNYQARNFMRDQMKVGDGVLIYHSNAEPPHIAGVATIAREGYPDHTQFDPAHHHYDPDSKEESPSWFMVDVKGEKVLPRPLPLPELRTIPGLERMVLLQKGSRLSVQPVTAAEWDVVLRLGGA